MAINFVIWPVWILAIFFATLPHARAAFRTKEAELTQWLEKHCSLKEKLRPTSNGEPVNLNLWLHLFRFQGLVSLEESFSVLADLAISWKHPCVKWGHDNETVQWAGINRITIEPASSWLPSIQHMNAVNDIYTLNKIGSQVTLTVEQTGTLNWAPIGLFKATCLLELRMFPNDVQTCSLEFEAWDSSDNVLFKRVNVSIVDKKNFMGKGQLWALSHLGANVYYKIYDNYDNFNYSHASFSLELKRYFVYYADSIFLPCEALTVLQICVLFMDPKLPERPIFSVTTVLAYAIVQNTISGTIPETSEILLMSICISCKFAIGMLMTVYTLVSAMLSRTSCYRKKRIVITGGHASLRLTRFVDLIFGVTITSLTISIDIAIYSLIAEKE